MAGEHVLKFQCSIPASATRYASDRLEGVTVKALEVLVRMVPKAYEIERKRIYRERKNTVGLIWWDILVWIQFRHPGPLPANVSQLKVFAEVSRQLKLGKGN